MAKAGSVHAEGPFPADTIYLRVGKGNYNAAGICSAYHP